MTETNQLSINAIRVLSAEAIQKANSGHPGTPLGAAPIGYTLFRNYLNFDVENSKWDNRDRFVLSAGHASALLYSLFHIFGMGISKEDMMDFRQLGSLTPGHPEFGQTAFVETTTGPLGQGIANAVGMAMAEAHLAAKYNRPSFPVVDHYTYVLCGDGCLEEGISYEACAFAGAHKLGKLILFYDSNDITIEGNLGYTFSEDVQKRFEAQNWQVLHVDLLENPNDVEAISAAIEEAQANTEQPTIIVCKTNIGFASPLEGSEKCHGAPLGVDNLQKTKEALDWTYEPFEIPEEVFEDCKVAGEKGKETAKEWQDMFDRYAQLYPTEAAEYKQRMSGVKPNFAEREDLFDFEKPMATRQTSSIILNKIAAELPSLMGGSADLGPSNLSIMKDTEDATYGDFSPENYAGRNIHFGIREHAMVAICNGLQLHGGVDAYSATFFIFTDYCKNAIRLSALMKLPTFYIFTHDSIGVGEDGPTHEPVEQLIALRSIPNLKVFRPADGKETAAAYVSAMKGDAPTALILSRQVLPQYENSGIEAIKGGYVLADCEGAPDVILIATGSEVEICMQAKAKLDEMGKKARVVSMPCMEEFEKQSEEYKQSVLPRNVRARVCVEAASPYSWYRYAGDYGEIIAMDGFGASAPAKELFTHFGFTAENVVEKALTSMKNAPIKLKLVERYDNN